MIQQVINIERKKYAVGLFWQPVASGFIARNYAKQLSRSIDKKLNTFIEYRAMVGLGAARNGHRTGLQSAAAEVMESFAEYSSFLAAFKIGTRIWMVAARNGIILEDKIFEDGITAHNQFLNFHAMPDWGALFAPGDWEVPRAVERRLSDIMTGKVRATIKPISRFKVNIISLVMIIVFLFGAFYFFEAPLRQIMTPNPDAIKMNPELAAEYKKRIEEKKLELDKKHNIKKKTTQVTEPVLMPYELIPDPYARAALCYQSIGFLMQNIIGWSQASAECGDEYAAATFIRKFGNLADFYEQASDLMPGVLVFEKTESEILITAKLPNLGSYASLEERDADTIVRAVNTAFQKLDMPVDINVKPQILNNGILDIEFSAIEIDATSKLSPPEFIKIFDSFSGVYMNLVKWDTKSRTWNYEVIVYAK